jgi:hypothetical protein
MTVDFQNIVSVEEAWDDDDDYCSYCDGDGVIVTCVDDLCQSHTGCIHGDGEIDCPNCN